MGGLRPVRVFVERFCGAARVDRETCLRLHLVLEELFTNTVRHGHKGDANTGGVWISVRRDGDCLRIVYEDTAPAFNPYAWLASAVRGAEPQRKPGGLGILLTRELAASREYAYVFGRNSIRLSMRLEQAASA